MKRLLPLIAVLLLNLAAFSPAFATVYQTDANGAWSMTTTWLGGLVPPTTMTATDTVNIDHALTAAADIILTPGARLTINASGALDITGYSLINQSNGGGLYMGGVNLYGSLTCDYLRNYGFSWIFIEPGAYLRVNGDVDNLGDIYVTGILEVVGGDFNHRAADIWVFSGGLISITNGDFNNYSTIRNLFPNSCIGILDGSFINHKNGYIVGSGGVSAADNVDNSANPQTNWAGVTWCAGGNGINVDPLLEDCSGPCNVVLPVEIAHFEAVPAAEGIVRLAWTTTVETNSLHFRIERSYDLQEFEWVGEIDAAGNSTEQLNYELNDQDHRGGLIYYRLTEIDIEGQEHVHGQVVSAFIEAPEQLFVAYPNPAKDVLTVQVDLESVESATIEIVNLQGAIVHTQKINASTQQIELRDLPRGLYMLNLKKLLSTESLKLVLD